MEPDIWSQSVRHFFPALESASSDQYLTTIIGVSYFSIIYECFRNNHLDLVFRFFVCSYSLCQVFNIVVPHEQKDQKINGRDPLMPLRRLIYYVLIVF